MLSGQKPFMGDTMEDLFTNIATKDIDFSIPQRQKYSSNLINLLKNMLNKNSA